MVAHLRFLVFLHLLIMLALPGMLFSADTDRHLGRVEGDGQWMRPGDATYLEWSFRNLGFHRDRFQHGIKVRLQLNVTNTVSGGSGYSTAVRVRVINPVTLEEDVFDHVWLQNTLQGATTVSQTSVAAIITNTNPSNTMGYGYVTFAGVTTGTNLISDSGRLLVRVEWKPDYSVADDHGIWHPHVGYYFDEDAVDITPADGAPINLPPIANAGADIVVEVPTSGSTASVMLDGSASVDPEGGTLSYLWYIPGHGEKTGVQPTYTGLGVGQYQANLTVTDDAMQQDSDAVRIDVVLHAPTASIDGILLNALPVTKIHEGCDWNLLFLGSAADSQYEITGWSWRSSIDGDLGSTEDLVVTPGTLSRGHHRIYFKVTNDQGTDSAEAESEFLVSRDPRFSTLYSRADLVGRWQGRTEVALLIEAQELDLQDVRVTMLVNPVQAGGPPPWKLSLGDINSNCLKMNTFRHQYFKYWDTTMCTQPFPQPGPSLLPEPREGAELHEIRFEVEGTDEAGWDFSFMVPGDYPDGDKYKVWLGIPGPKKAHHYALAYNSWRLSVLAPPRLEDMGARISNHSLWIVHASIAHDPFWEDPDFQSLVEVQWPEAPPLIAGPGSPPELEGLYRLSSHGALAALTGEAYYSAGARMCGAVAAGDPMAAYAHGVETLRFAHWFREELFELGDAFELVQPLVEAMTEADVQGKLDELIAEGFPPEINQALLDYGMTQGEIDAIIPGQTAAHLVLEEDEDLGAPPRQAAAMYPEEIRKLLPSGAMYVAVTNPRKGGWASGTVHIDAAIWDKEPNMEWSMVPVLLGVSVDGGLLGAELPIAWNTTSAVEGQHTIGIDVQYADPVLGIASDVITVVVDNTPPVLTIVSPAPVNYPEGVEIPVETIVTDNLDENAAVVCLLLDGERVASPLSPGPGSHTLEVVASDRAGNTTAQSVSFGVASTRVADWDQFPF